ncbi:MAG: hypothetical protein U1F53_08800 [Burkholderiaceae bacterium]
MVHPIFSTLLTRPELLAEHAGAYAELASVEAAIAADEWCRRGVWAASALVLALLGVGWGGVALLLAAAWPAAQMPAPWVLVALPAVSLGLALAVAVVAAWRRRRATPAFALLRQQIAEDGALLREGLAHG